MPAGLGFFGIWIFVLSPTALAEVDDHLKQPKVISIAPDEGYQLRRLPAESGDRGQAQKAMEITSKTGKILYRWVSPIGAVTALWSPDSTFLAVNEAPGDRGDQLRVFRIGNDQVIPAREPSAVQLRSAVEEKHGSFLSRLEEASIRGIEWRDGKLWCDVHGSMSPKRQPTVRVPFHDLWVFSFKTGELVIEEVWSRTEPRERAYRRE